MIFIGLASIASLIILGIVISFTFRNKSDESQKEAKTPKNEDKKEAQKDEEANNRQEVEQAQSKQSEIIDMDKMKSDRSVQLQAKPTPDAAPEMIQLQMQDSPKKDPMLLN